MTPYPNLISESLLINETVALLRSFGGRASAVSVVDFVMKIRKPDRNLARLLAAIWLNSAMTNSRAAS